MLRNIASLLIVRNWVYACSICLKHSIRFNHNAFVHQTYGLLFSDKFTQIYCWSSGMAIVRHVYSFTMRFHRNWTHQNCIVIRISSHLPTYSRFAFQFSSFLQLQANLLGLTFRPCPCLICHHLSDATPLLVFLFTPDFHSKFELSAITLIHSIVCNLFKFF